MIYIVIPIRDVSTEVRWPPTAFEGAYLGIHCHKWY